ncbi:hypothetical protein BV898_16818 [Hypsibius exemplaris]|uniref:Uncharacterized protein n=1 Tax=Hypsibius exemplaris TaxID=2072580 RepID=A0A9X6NG15_HYPEX|nr:hypothetical protein BV898_16818 [Hypsibius exemplaris]
MPFDHLIMAEWRLPRLIQMRKTDHGGRSSLLLFHMRASIGWHAAPRRSATVMPRRRHQELPKLGASRELAGLFSTPLASCVVAVVESRSAQERLVFCKTEWTEAKKAGRKVFRPLILDRPANWERWPVSKLVDMLVLVMVARLCDKRVKGYQRARWFQSRAPQ